MTDTSKSGQFTPGAVRTATPFLVGWLVSAAARHGLDINDDNAAYLIGAVGGYLFWVVVRFCEMFLGEKWRYVLGLGLVSAAPAYVQGEAVVSDDTGTGRIPAGRDSGQAELGLILVVLGIAVALLVSHLLGVILLVVGVVVLLVPALNRR